MTYFVICRFCFQHNHRTQFHSSLTICNVDALLFLSPRSPCSFLRCHKQKSSLKDLLTNFKGRAGWRERPLARYSHPQGLEKLGLHQAEARSLEFHLGLPHWVATSQILGSSAALPDTAAGLETQHIGFRMMVKYGMLVSKAIFNLLYNNTNPGQHSWSSICELSLAFLKVNISTNEYVYNDLHIL